jgi:16S rRNA (guanine966-N2)-methyltransferase
VPDAGRVITGAAGGLRLRAPGAGTRPLSDKVKQALFSMLEAEREDIWERPMLDLFAGSGAAGIEALSRGAPVAVFVERDARATSAIRANLDSTHLAPGGRVLRRDALALLADAAGVVEMPFGCVVLDPPYEQVDALHAALELLASPAASWLDDDAIVVAKHFWKDEPPASPGVLELRRRRRFGETELSVYRRAPQPAPGGG